MKKPILLLFTLTVLFYVSSSQCTPLPYIPPLNNFPVAAPHRMLQMLRVLSSECNFHGFLFKNQCFCEKQYSGAKCEIKSERGIYDTDDKCDDLSARIDFLTNISPDYYPGDDDMFSRLDGKSIGEGEASYGDKGSSWIKMHDIVSNFTIFNELEPTDIRQGALGDCYLLAAFASLTTINRGSIIKDVFTSMDDNPNHVYVSRWLIDGKPRYVAVDDWVPGKGQKPSFAQPSANNETWPVILEKAWAKIHGTFMAIEAGWHTDVWQALTQAPGYDKYHNAKDTPEATWLKIVGLRAKNYPVGAATVNVLKTNEVAGHAYSVLGAYEVKLNPNSNQTEKLIHMYNPWNKEVWATNPWGDKSTNWTDYTKSQVPYVDSDDGAFFIAASDYLQNFGATNWAELMTDYDIAFQDIALKDDLTADQKYSTVFSYVVKDPTDTLYIQIDQSDTRLNLGCDNPFNVVDLKVTTPAGKVVGMDIYGYNVKIYNATSGNYSVSATIRKMKDYVKYFTVTIYGPQAQSVFVPLLNNDIEYRSVDCPSNCSNHGDCNNFNGKCICDFGWSGNDCSTEGTAPPPTPVDQTCDGKDCSNNGICIGGSCMCNNGFSGDNCETSDSDLCAGKNCSGKGLCLPQNGECMCNQGFLGDNCEQKDKCFNETCSGNGQCDKNSGACICIKGYLGNKCEKQSLCLNKNCSGNGVCNPASGQCICFNGYEGDTCNTEPKPKPNITCNCSKHGVCPPSTPGVCKCDPNYTGKNCESRDKCNGRNCSGRGSCAPLIGQCICVTGYTGANCETLICGGNNCSKNGICNKINGKCTCFSGFEGNYCQTQTNPSIIVRPTPQPKPVPFVPITDVNNVVIPTPTPEPDKKYIIIPLDDNLPQVKLDKKEPKPTVVVDNGILKWGK